MTDDLLTKYLQTQIISVTGRPANLNMTKITKISDSCYRVNLFCNTTNGVVEQYEVCDSYFVTIDEDGNILSSEPTLKKR